LALENFQAFWIKGSFLKSSLLKGIAAGFSLVMGTDATGDPGEGIVANVFEMGTAQALWRRLMAFGLQVHPL